MNGDKEEDGPRGSDAGYYAEGLEDYIHRKRVLPRDEASFELDRILRELLKEDEDGD